MARFVAVLLSALLVGSTAAVLWAFQNPDAPIVVRAESWPIVGPWATELRRRGPTPFTIPPEGPEEWESADGGGPDRPRSRRRTAPARGTEADEPLPPLTPEGVERITVKPGIPLLAEPRPGAARVLVPVRVAVLKVLERRPGWVKVQYGGQDGWVPDPEWTGPEPPLGSDPDPVRPVAGRAPDEPRLMAARGRLAPPETAGRIGPYLLYTDVRDADRLAFLDRVAAGMDAVYRARYGLAPTGEPAEAVVLFAREADYRSFLREETDIGELPATGHTGYGIVSLYDGGRPADDVGATLVHELTHLLNRRAIGPALPSWLEEGLADDLSQSQIDPAGRVVPGTLGGVTVRAGRRIEMHGARAALQNLIQAAESGGLRPFPALLAMDWNDFVRRDAELNYAQSSFFIRYLLQAEQGSLAPAFRSFLADVAEGVPPEPERLREKIGRPWPALEAGFRLWLLGAREDRPLVP